MISPTGKLLTCSVPLLSLVQLLMACVRPLFSLTDYIRKGYEIPQSSIK